MKDAFKEINLKRYSTLKILDSYNKLAIQGLNKVEEILIDKYFKKQSKILDLGCGTGRTTLSLKKKNFDVIGIDFSKSMIDIAKKVSKRERLDINYLVMDVCSLDFDDCLFDGLFFSFNGFEQISKNNRLKALKQMHRVLKPGGYLILSTYNILNPMNFLISIKHFLFNKKTKKFGEWVVNTEGAKLFIYVSNPFKLSKILKNIGFKRAYINSEICIQKEQKCLFWFLRKPSIYYIFFKR
jgi:ubiquinone/menaquinone biosynthesis C-methylase UbiE